MSGSPTLLLIPGLRDEAPGHWQSILAGQWPGAVSLPALGRQNIDLAARVAQIEEAVQGIKGPVVIVAHSLAISALVHAAPRFPEGKVKGALLVSPPDHEAPGFPKEGRSFDGVPSDPLPFPSLLVVSNNDPYVTAERAADMATAWGSELHFAGEAGHINVASGHGPWPEGLLMFTRLMQRI